MGDANSAPPAELTHIFFLPRPLPTDEHRLNPRLVYVMYEHNNDAELFPGWGWFEMAIDFYKKTGEPYYNPDLLEANVENMKEIYKDIIDKTTDWTKSLSQTLKYSIYALALTDYNNSQQLIKDNWQTFWKDSSKPIENTDANVEMWCNAAWMLYENFVQRLSRAKMLMGTNLKMFTEHREGTGPDPQRYTIAADKAVWLNRTKEKNRFEEQYAGHAVIDYAVLIKALTHQNVALRECEKQLYHSAERQTYTCAIQYVKQQISGCVFQAQWADDPKRTTAQDFLYRAGTSATVLASILKAAEFAAMLGQTIVQDQMHENATRNAAHKRVVEIPNQYTGTLDEENVRSQCRLANREKQQQRNGEDPHDPFALQNRSDWLTGERGRGRDEDRGTGRTRKAGRGRGGQQFVQRATRDYEDYHRQQNGIRPPHPEWSSQYKRAAMTGEQKRAGDQNRNLKALAEKEFSNLNGFELDPGYQETLAHYRARLSLLDDNIQSKRKSLQVVPEEQKEQIKAEIAALQKEKAAVQAEINSKHVTYQEEQRQIAEQKKIEEERKKLEEDAEAAAGEGGEAEAEAGKGEEEEEEAGEREEEEEEAGDGAEVSSDTSGSRKWWEGSNSFEVAPPSDAPPSDAPPSDAPPSDVASDEASDEASVVDNSDRDEE